MSTRQFLALVAGIMVYVIFVFATSDVGRAFAIGGDDGIELAKSLLLERAPDRLHGMWNDQPWLHTMITARLFSIFGEASWAPRLVSVGSMLCFLVALCAFYRSALSLPGLVGLVVLLLTSDELDYMTFSGMTEVPAITVATTAALCCAIGTKRNRLMLIIAGGLLYSAALHIKLTALLILACIAFCCLTRDLRQSLRNLGIFGITAAIGFWTIATVSPSFNWREIWSTHTDTRNILLSVGTSQVFKVIYLVESPALVLAATFGMLFLIKERQWVLVGIPGLLLLGASCFALLQRPWWKFYLVQLNIPLAMLGAFGLDRLLRNGGCGELSRGVSRNWQNPALLFILCLWCGFTLPAYLKALELNIYSRHKFEDERIVRAARVYSAKEGIDSCYAIDPALVFASGMLTPPSLTVVSQKRMLVTGLDYKGIAAEVRRLNLPMLILRSDGEADHLEWLCWLTNDYQFVLQGSANELWLKRSLNASVATFERQPDLRLRYVRF